MIDRNDGDYITINTKDGIKKEAELVSKFEIENLGQYVIYKLDDKLYGAKYYIEDDTTKLITNLSDEEKEILNEVVQKLEVK